MTLLKWAEIPEEPLSDTLTRRAFSGEKVTVAWFVLRKGCFVPAHSHENEQMSTVLSGSVRFVLDGRECLVRAGETLHIPPGASHSAEALEDSVVLDAFAPVRADWVQGRDAYLRAS
jgi:quercetin dioxygenase-like cupin family protein